MRRRPVARLILAGLAGLGAIAVGAAALAAEQARLRFVVAIYFDDKGAGMRQPEGVACNDRSSLIVADTGKSRLLRFTVEGRDVKPLGQIVGSQLSSPIRVQTTSKDEVLVLDGKQRRVLRFGADGAFRDYLNPEGVPEPSGVVPRSLRVGPDDAIYLLDVFSARVLVLDSGGKYLRQVPFPKAYGFPSDLAVDARGGIYLVDSLRAAVYLALRDAKEFSLLAGNLRAHLSFPTSLTIDSRGILYLVDEHGGGVVLLGQDGSVLGRQLAMGWNDGLVRSPAGICLNAKGQVFIADRGNNRVQVFALVR